MVGSPKNDPHGREKMIRDDRAPLKKSASEKKYHGKHRNQCRRRYS
jgi:hypothetical protein